MSYYSVLQTDIRIKADKIDDFKRYIDTINSISDVNRAKWSFELTDDYYLDEDSLYPNDYHNQWEFTDEVICSISEYLINQTIEWVGEDGSRWGVEIVNGVVYDVIYPIARGQILEFDETYVKSASELKRGY